MNTETTPAVFSRNQRIYWVILTGICILITLLPLFIGIWAVAAIIGIGVFTLAFLKPKLGVIALLFLQVGLTKSTAGLTTIEIVYLFLFSVVFIGWVLRLSLKRGTKLFSSPLNYPILLFLALCLFSIGKAYYNGVNIIDWFTEWRVFLVLILFFVIVNEFQSKQQLRWLVHIFLLTAALVCLQDIFLISQRGYFEGRYIGEVAGIQYASLYFIMAIPLSISVFLGARNFWLRWTQIPLLVLFSFRLVVSLMRSYIFALSVTLFFFIIMLLILRIKKVLFRMIILLTFMCFLSVTVFLIFPAEISGVVRNLVARFAVLKDFYSPQNTSALQRIVENKAIWNYVLRQPLLGYGFGFRYQYYGPNQEFHDIPYAHCVPLFFFLKTGLVGILIITWLVIRVLFLNWQVFKAEKELYWKILELAFFWNFISIIILSFFITSVVRIDSVFYFTLAIGVIATLKKLQNRSKMLSQRN